MDRKRKKLAKQRLLLAAQTLCDSNKKDREQEALKRILRYAYELLPRDRLNDEQRKKMSGALEQCATVANVELDGRVVMLEGTFDTNEIHRRFVLMDDRPVITVNGEGQ